MASMPMQPIDPDSRVDPSQNPYERGHAAGVAETEEKYKALVAAAMGVGCTCEEVDEALRQLEEEKP